MADLRNRNANITAMIQAPTASDPMNPNESVDSAKIHTAGTNPNSNNPASASAPAKQVPSWETDTRAPASVEKI